MPKLKVIKSETLSKYGDPRYVVIDEDTGELLDDAQGYGYRSMQKAYAGAGYKFRDKSRDKERVSKERAIQSWMKEHESFVNAMDDTAFELAKGSWGPEDTFDTKLVKELLEQFGYTDLPFTAGELYRFWHNGPVYSKRRRKKKRKK